MTRIAIFCIIVLSSCSIKHEMKWQLRSSPVGRWQQYIIDQHFKLLKDTHSEEEIRLIVSRELCDFFLSLKLHSDKCQRNIIKSIRNESNYTDSVWKYSCSHFPHIGGQNGVRTIKRNAVLCHSRNE